MLNALISGTLATDPKSGTSQSGTTWANCVVRCPCGQNRETGDAESAFVQVACFGSHAESLARLGKGDAVSATGAMKQTTYQRDGQERHGLSLTATAILTPYQIRQKRGDQASSNSQASANSGGGKNYSRMNNSDRAQAHAYLDFARQAAGPAHDDTFDSEVPF